ncbi:MAG: bifunctional phosphoribosyl-AMP cyclohydrolase/phosphoribosyl-ATP diphosphatase HisIE, partial [Nitrospinota bacterium]
ELDGRVLMVAYMNAESLAQTIESGYTHFWSRSRRQLWKKGETSGHTQRVRRLTYDCDADCLLVQVEQTGPACHTGEPSCFFQTIEADFGEPARPASGPEVLERLSALIKERLAADRDDSYVAELGRGGGEAITEKVMEEASEVTQAAQAGDADALVHEMADLWFHALVLLGYEGVELERVFGELTSRFGISGLERKTSDGSASGDPLEHEGGES